MRFYKDDGREYINAESPKEVTLEIALTEVEKLPAIWGYFIGLINEKEETIQFVRLDKNAWLIDIPICENGICSYVLQDSYLTTEKVKDVVEKFFVNENWKSSLILKKLPANELTDTKEDTHRIAFPGTQFIS